MQKPPSDIVELIIAVDLDPTNPEEPINVSNVDVRKDGEEGDGDWRKLVMQLLMGDKRAGVTSDTLSYEEAVEASKRVLEGHSGDEDAPEAPKPHPLDEPMRPERMPGMRPERKPGDMMSALDRALGRKPKDDDEDEE